MNPQYRSGQMLHRILSAGFSLICFKTDKGSH
jgi:hypothetical protein